MNQSKYKYIQISGNHISNLSAMPREEFSRFESEGLKSMGRIFVKTTEVPPAGSPLQFELEVPGEGEYQVKGLAEWSNDGDAGDKEIGVAVRLLEVSTKTVATGEGEEASGETAGPSQSDSSTGDQADESAAEAGEEKEKVIPTAEEISEILESLFGEQIKVTGGSPVELTEDKPLTVATIILDDGSVSSIITADLKITVYVGSCLAEIPLDQAKKYISKDEMPENVTENFREVLNIISSTFNKPDLPHVTLGETYTSLEDVTDEHISAIRGSSRRRDMTIEIPDYGEGQMSILAV